MEKSKVKISVALCTYNGEKYLQEQLDSIINQTMKVDQIVLSDDNSKDSTIAILENFKKRYCEEYDINVIRNIPGLGVVKNFEGAIKCCTGDIIFTSDQDDIWVKDKVHKIVNTIIDENALLVFTDALLIDNNGISMNTKMWQTLKFKYIDRYSTQSRILQTNVVTGATMAFSKELISTALPFVSNDKYMLHDYWLAINASNRIVGLSDCLTLYRQHENNVVGARLKKGNIIQSLFSEVNRFELYYQSVIEDYMRTFRVHEFLVHTNDLIALNNYNKTYIFYSSRKDYIDNKIGIIKLVKSLNSISLRSLKKLTIAVIAKQYWKGN